MGKKEVYAALYDVPTIGRVERRCDVFLVRVDDLVGHIDRRCRILGDGVERYGDLLEAAIGSNAIVLPMTHYRPRGSVVARLGAQTLATGCEAVLGSLEPFYLRPASAERQRILDSPACALTTKGDV